MQAKQPDTFDALEGKTDEIDQGPNELGPFAIL